MNTDTCPDCSNIPCDCGMPAGYTPTPRTDFAIKASNGRWNFVLKLCSERLERELTAAREEIVKLTKGWADCVLRLSKAEEQRDQYKAALQSADNHNHEIATKLEIVTEQRDEARRLAEKYRNLSCQDQDQADATLLPWETNQSIEP